jgi:hypothetical protein
MGIHEDLRRGNTGGIRVSNYREFHIWPVNEELHFVGYIKKGPNPPIAVIRCLPDVA